MPTHFHVLIKVNSLQPEDQSIDLNFSIGKLLSSYTRALQKDQKLNGSLFQSHTKAKCLNKIEEITSAYWTTEFGSMINAGLDNYSYPQICFHYIHLNPVMDKLVGSPENWEFSSYRDYFCGRKGTLIDYNLALEEGLIENVKIP
jgi:putative transposase